MTTYVPPVVEEIDPLVLVGEVERLRVALERYGRHESRCPAKAWDAAGERYRGRCDCGLTEALHVRVSGASD